MTQWFFEAPVHRGLLCAGAFVLSLLLAGACDRTPVIGDKGDRTLVLHADTIQLDGGVTLHDVKIRASPAGDFDPPQLSAHAGDVVRFTTEDTYTHALVFAQADPEAMRLLNASGQRRSPPLVTRGQAWVVSLKGLPGGSYTISCVSHAGTATLVVQ